MSIVVREDLSVTIPSEMAAALGIHEGSSVEWLATPQGSLLLRPTSDRQAAIDELRGMLRGFAQDGESSVESFLRWRDEERLLEENL